jgi:site-specific DNA-cytosine methylase
MSHVAQAAAAGVAVELCAGFGGIGIGLRALGFHVARAYDSWEEAVAAYNHNFPGEAAVRANLLTERGRRVVRNDRRGPSNCTACFPWSRQRSEEGEPEITRRAISFSSSSHFPLRLNS